MTFAVAGSVSSTRVVLQTLVECGASVPIVFGLDEAHSKNVSGFEDICALARKAGLQAQSFRSINEPRVLETLRARHVDYFFVVGLSQLVGPELLALPRRGCIGFHPTHLPQGRGRAPVAWLVLENCPGAATLFLMDQGADSGPILAQEPFEVGPDDYAQDVVLHIERALAAAMRALVPKLIDGAVQPQPQTDSAATYFAKRGPEDGLIDWSWDAEEIYRLVRAASRPHPGAFTFFRQRKLIVWRARPEKGLKLRGVIGRIVELAPNGNSIVQAGQGLLRLEEIQFDDGCEPDPLRVGAKLGIDSQLAAHDLLKRIAALEAKLGNQASPK